MPIDVAFLKRKMWEGLICTYSCGAVFIIEISFLIPVWEMRLSAEYLPGIFTFWAQSLALQKSNGELNSCFLFFSTAHLKKIILLSD